MKANSVQLLRCAARSSRTRIAGFRGAQYGVRWSSSERQWSTPLAKSLAQAITTTGPISVASYMRQCLTSPDGGYYTRQTSGHDQFGKKGDFITSPEISQVFGELVGIWLTTQWHAQGESKRVHIIEVGPGRGTLMDDVLRTISCFKSFATSIEHIYLVEASPHLRQQQADLLCEDELEKKELGWTGICKYKSPSNIKITWCEDIRFIPKDEASTPFILAHEFFDALPIHVFQNISSSSIPASSTILTPTGPIKPKHGPHTPGNQWHELVVSPTTPETKFQSPPGSTSTSAADPAPDFQLTVSKTPTPHSLYLPQTSSRYKALSKTENAIIEISPESLSYVSDFAERIGGSNPTKSTSTSKAPSASATSSKTVQTTTPPPFKKSKPSGAALILDYGPLSTIPSNTLRGIRSHRTVSPFTSPGLVDLSADVDFLALAETALAASPGVEVHGPVEQAFFLGSMGIQQRAEQLLKSTEAGEAKERLESGWKRLVDRGPTGMGRIYKALAIVPYFEDREVRRPVGFGGDVI